MLETLPPPPGTAAASPEAKVATYWASAIDEAAIEALGKHVYTYIFKKKENK